MRGISYNICTASVRWPDVRTHPILAMPRCCTRIATGCRAATSPTRSLPSPRRDQAEGFSRTNHLHGGRHVAWRRGPVTQFQTEGNGLRADEPNASDVDFHGQQRLNRPMSQSTDLEARLSKKRSGANAKPGLSGHLLTENRHGFTSTRPSPARPAHGRTRRRDRDAGELPLTTDDLVVSSRQELRHARRRVAAVRAMAFTPHVAQFIGYRATCH